MTKDEKLEKLYKEIPDAGCKGLCTRFCGPISCSTLEMDRMKAANPDAPIGDSGISCPFLVEGRCSVYSVRPVICRVFGSAEGIQCPHGCKPKRGLMRKRAVTKICKKVHEIAGSDEVASTHPEVWEEAVRIQASRRRRK